MGYQYDPKPGPPLDPTKYGAIGPNGQRYGEQPKFKYNPVTDKYDPVAEEPKKPSLLSTVGPLAGAAGAYALGSGIIKDPKGAFTGIKEGLGSLYDTVTAPFSGFGNTPVTSVPAATATSPTFSLGAESASAAASGAAAPFSGVGPVANGAQYAGMLGAEGSAITGVSGVGPVADGAQYAASLGASEAPFSLSGAAGAVAPYIAPAIGAYGAYDLFSQDKTSGRTGTGGTALQGAASGAAIGSYFGPPGMLVGGILGGLAGAAHNMFGSRKGKEQLARDEIRSFLQSKGLIDDQYRIQNADGSVFDVGKDGGAMLEGGAYDGKRHYYDVNLDDPNQVSLIPIADALATLHTGGDKKLTSDFAGYLINAATSSGDPRANIEHYFQTLGLDHDKAYGMIHEMSLGGGKDGKPLLSKDVADSYKNSLDSWFHVGAFSGGKNPSSASAPVVQTPKPQVAAAPPSPTPRPAPQGAAPPVNVAAPQAAKPKPIVRGLGQR